MLYNYVTKRKYSIDIDSLMSILEQNKRSLIEKDLLHNAAELFTAWQQLLFRLYTAEMPAYDDSEMEFFQKLICYGDMKIYMHFNINFLKTHAHTAQTTLVPLDIAMQFTDYELIPKINLEYISPSSDPVFVVPYPKGEKRCLLVDGNHRFSSSIYNRQDVLVSNFSLNVTATSLMNRFEQAFYCYEFEVWQYESAGANYYPLEKSKVRWF